MDRRKYITLTASILTIPLAGCSYTGTQPAGDVRELQLQSASATKVDSEWILRVVVFNQDNTMGETYFHNVKLLAYSEHGSLVCEKSIGDIDNQVNVELSCSDFPHFIAVDARESPCDEKNDLMLLEYEGEDGEGEHVWKTRYRKCGEKLPPDSG